jgi:hypothetical protein
MGIDATFPFGGDEQKADDVPAGEACGPAFAEHGHEFFKVADVPGWQEYDFGSNTGTRVIPVRGYQQFPKLREK